MAIVWKVSANPIYILTNNDLPDLSSAKVIVQCYDVDDDTGVETQLSTSITNAIGTNCTVTRSGNVATITGVSANNGSVDLYAQSGANFRMLTIPFLLVKFAGKAQITISIVDDGYTINCTPSNIVIPANADGSNPILTGAKTRVLLSKAGVNIPVTITSIVATGCTASHSGNEATITAVSVLTGNLQIHFKATGDPYESYVNVPFSVTKNGANGNDGLPGQNGKDGISVILSNEVHALPANHDGSVSQASIDTAVCSITVLKGSMPLTPVAANATPGIGQFRYNIQSFPGGTAIRVRDIYNSDTNNTFKLATITASIVKIKVFIYAESLANPIEREMTVTKVNGADPTEFEEVKSVFDNWKYADSTEIDGAKIKTGTIAADKIIVESLIARYFQTNNVGARTTINVLPVDSSNPTSNPTYYVSNAIRQYHDSGRISMYEGIVKNLTITVSGVSRTINGQAKVVYKDEVGSPILYVVDSYTQNGLQYVSTGSSATWYPIGVNRLSAVFQNISWNASKSIFESYLETTALPANNLKTLLNGRIDYVPMAGSIWINSTNTYQVRYPGSGESNQNPRFVTSQNGTTPIADGWYFVINDNILSVGSTDIDPNVGSNHWPAYAWIDITISFHYIESGYIKNTVTTQQLYNIATTSPGAGGSSIILNTTEVNPLSRALVVL